MAGFSFRRSVFCLLDYSCLTILPEVHTSLKGLKLIAPGQKTYYNLFHLKLFLWWIGLNWNGLFWSSVTGLTLFDTPSPFWCGESLSARACQLPLYYKGKSCTLVHKPIPYRHGACQIKQDQTVSWYCSVKISKDWVAKALVSEREISIALKNDPNNWLVDLPSKLIHTIYALYLPKK